MIPARISKRNIKVEFDHINFVSDRVIFIHIPKCAGTTISKYYNLEQTKHITYNEIASILGPEVLFTKYSTFAFVRNPYTRFVSLYNYARLEKSHYHDNTISGYFWGKNHQDYKLLKEATIEDCIDYLEEGKLRNHSRSWNQWSPQYTWLVNDLQEIKVNRIAKVENIREGLIEINSTYNLTSGTIEHLNKSDNGTILTDSIRERIYDYYKKDFELFDYNN